MDTPDTAPAASFTTETYLGVQNVANYSGRSPYRQGTAVFDYPTALPDDTFAFARPLGPGRTSRHRCLRQHTTVTPLASPCQGHRTCDRSSPTAPSVPATSKWLCPKACRHIPSPTVDVEVCVRKRATDLSTRNRLVCWRFENSAAKVRPGCNCGLICYGTQSPGGQSVCQPQQQL